MNSPPEKMFKSRAQLRALNWVLKRGNSWIESRIAHFIRSNNCWCCCCLCCDTSIGRKLISKLNQRYLVVTRLIVDKFSTRTVSGKREKESKRQSVDRAHVVVVTSYLHPKILFCSIQFNLTQFLATNFKPFEPFIVTQNKDTNVKRRLSLTFLQSSCEQW